jgi:lysine-N-methylase
MPSSNPLPSDGRNLTMRYVTEFACTGGDCPDNCCHGWQVQLDKKTYEDLQRSMSLSSSEQERFEANVTRNQGPSAGAGRFATIGLDSCGLCTFQEAGSGLCSIQKEYGEPLLGQVCSIYPRQLNRYGQGTELSMTLSCPEAARLCLSSPKATDLVPLAPELVANEKYFLTHLQSDTEPDPYPRHAGVVRQVLWDLLGTAGYPLSTRLFFCAYFAHRISPFFRAGMLEDDLGALPGEVERIGQPEFLRELSEQIQKVQDVNDLAMTIILTILMGRSRDDSRLKERLQEIWVLYGGAEFQQSAVRALEKGQTDFDFGSPIRQFHRRRDHLEKIFGTAHDQHLENYCFSYLFRENCTGAPTVLAHVQNLLIRRAILRFLVFSDPRWNEWMERPSDHRPTASELKQFEESAVDIFYRFSRTIEHSVELTQRIQDTLAAQGMQSLPHLVMQLKI